MSLFLLVIVVFFSFRCYSLSVFACGFYLLVFLWTTVGCENIALCCRWCHLASFVWCFGYIAFFRTAHMFGLPEVSPHANAVQLFLTLRVTYMRQRKLAANFVHNIYLMLNELRDNSPYHTGKMFYRLALRPLMGPIRIPKLTVFPQVQYSAGSLPTLGTIPLTCEGLLTWTYPPTRTLNISKRTSA